MVETASRIRALTVDRDEDGAVRAVVLERDAPTATTGQVIVRPLFVGLCGSDVEQLHDRMPDTFVIEFPHTLGHEWVGEIVETGPDVTGLAVGDRVVGHGHLGGNSWFGVTTDGALADLFPVAAEMCFPVPESIDSVTAAVIEPFACMLRGLLRAGGVSAVDTVHVYGLGAMGLCAVVQAVSAQARVYGFDLSEVRRRKAVELGAAGAFDPRETESDAVPPASLVIEVTGSPRALGAALESAGQDARVLLMGVSASRAEPVRLGLVQERGLTIMSSTGAPAEIWPAAIRFVERTKAELSRIVTTIVPLDRFEEAIERAQSPATDIKVLIQP